MSLIDQYAGLVVDLDGVVLRGEEPIKPATAFLRRAEGLDVEIVFVTNNSTRTAQQWQDLMVEVKVPTPPERIVSSATAVAELLAGDPPAKCLVIGEDGLLAALRDVGVEIVEDHEVADTVVVGADEQLTYAKLEAATRAILGGARFVATNPDAIRPTDEGPQPGTGATLAYLRAATGVAPEVAGKPQAHLLELAAERLAVDGPMLLVGDQVETDISAAQRMGWDSALVLTGVDGCASLVGARATPTWVIADLGELDGPEPPAIRHAREDDLPDIRRLLDEGGLDSSRADHDLRRTLVAEGPEGRVVGTASWEMVGSAAHLYGLTVDRRERRHGTGSHLVVRVLDELYQGNETDWVYLLTPVADGLFEQLGFWRVHRDRVPEEILQLAHFGSAGSDARAFVRRLRGGGRG